MDIPPGALTQVMSLPWVIQVLAVIVVIGIVMQAAPQMSGRFQSTIESWTNGRRRTKTASKDADVSALSKQVDNMQTVLADTRAELALSRRELRDFRNESRKYQQAHDEVLGTHALWDQAMIERLIELGGTPIPKPALWPDRDTAQSASLPMTNT